MALEEKNLPGSCHSPRISGGVLKWYEGDTFELQVRMELTDETGAEIRIEPAHRVRFVFRNACRKTVCEMPFQGIEANTVILRFTEDVSALFPKGRYTYDVIYEGAVRRSLASDAPILVE